MDNEDSILIKKIEGYYKRADIGKPSLTNFLNSHEIQVAKRLIRPGYTVFFDGGFFDSEHQRMGIAPLGYDIDHMISIFRVDYNKKHISFNHRHILGNLMALGLKRDSIGDIIIGNNIYFIAKKELDDFFLNEVKTMNGYPVSLVKVDEIIDSKLNEMTEKIIFPQSLRLDSIVALAFGIARSKCQEMISDGMVKVNQVINQNNSYNCKFDDLISVKTKGRIKVLGINGQTKSGRINVVIGIFG